MGELEGRVGRVSFARVGRVSAQEYASRDGGWAGEGLRCWASVSSLVSLPHER